MKADVRVALARAGFDDVEVRTVLAPAWSTDWISERGRRALAEHGIVPPGPVADGPVPLSLDDPARAAAVPAVRQPARPARSRGSAPVPCTSFHVCSACGEPFDKVKEL